MRQKNHWRIAIPALFILAGCNRVALPQLPEPMPASSPSPAVAVEIPPAPSPVPTPTVTFPVAEYSERRTLKVFGQYVQDRFLGYHTGDDVEYADAAGDVPVLAIADGEVVVAKRVSGYGGVMIVRQVVNGKTISALYGHLDLQSAKPVGASVKRGEQLAILGDHQSAETDGERKHLHFHLWEGAGEKTAGYAQTPAVLAEYHNPSDFFAENNLAVTPPARPITYGGIGATAPHPTFSGVTFTLPAGWAVEYVPQIQSLNLFTLAGVGPARERSQIFIRTFTADRFLTLSTVTIFTTESGQLNGRESRRYDIAKKPNVADFPHQPSWRNLRHEVTDIRAKAGHSVFYVIAQNPALEEKNYREFLATFTLGTQ